MWTRRAHPTCTHPDSASLGCKFSFKILDSWWGCSWDRTQQYEGFSKFYLSFLSMVNTKTNLRGRERRVYVLNAWGRAGGVSLCPSLHWSENETVYVMYLSGLGWTIVTHSLVSQRVSVNTAWGQTGALIGSSRLMLRATPIPSSTGHRGIPRLVLCFWAMLLGQKWVR